eukprot:CAMPEP_0172473896 /NCGR_PEP_ID=MMETSP1065-20121228/69085_1 /TAXON_ID=265537 /ORGANISM="Amphiprora paludosa, Strain CCMP125" /LENGTH=348 /DNA_ID=CAMNT_0013232073 /DNA_START=113 /DNA_END=1159 /DNA_ORIENTATION=+
MSWTDAFLAATTTPSNRPLFWSRNQDPLSIAATADSNDNDDPPPTRQQKKEQAANEWGVPLSSTLPPLDTSSQRPRSKILPNGGQMTLLGSGPGDPELLTVAAYRMLSTADENTLVVADRLVSPEILNLLDTSKCQLKVARKLPGCADLAQEEIYWWCYQGLNQGQHVIRLKIGDPFVFGRGGEEVLTFREFGVEPTVVPGVSAAFSAPLLGNIPVTHRGSSNQVVMCTGYGRQGTSPDLIQYHKEQTVVFLMAVGRLRELTERLQTMAHYPADTPVAIVEKAGCPQQRTVVGDMTNIADLAEWHKVQPPSTIVVGDVVRVLLEDEAENGQEQQPIMGLIQNFTSTSA